MPLIRQALGEAMKLASGGIQILCWTSVSHRCEEKGLAEAEGRDVIRRI
jgi:hypothetical protein